MLPQVSWYPFLTLLSGLTFYILWLIPFCSPLNSVSVWYQTIPQILNVVEKLLWMPRATEVSAEIFFLGFLTHRNEKQNKIIVWHWDLGSILLYKEKNN